MKETYRVVDGEVRSTATATFGVVVAVGCSIAAAVLAKQLRRRRSRPG
jgi:hypothetical protein